MTQQRKRIGQKHIDGSISKTINLPKDYKAEDLKPILLKYLRELKGVTVYREGSKGEEPLRSLPLEEAAVAIGKKHVTAAKERDCSSGTCTI